MGPLGIWKKEKQQSFSRICSQSDAKSCEEGEDLWDVSNWNEEKQRAPAGVPSWPSVRRKVNVKNCCNSVQQVLMLPRIFALFGQLWSTSRKGALDKVRNGQKFRQWRTHLHHIFVITVQTCKHMIQSNVEKFRPVLGLSFTQQNNFDMLNIFWRNQLIKAASVTDFSSTRVKKRKFEKILPQN